MNSSLITLTGREVHINNPREGDVYFVHEDDSELFRITSKGKIEVNFEYKKEFSISERTKFILKELRHIFKNFNLEDDPLMFTVEVGIPLKIINKRLRFNLEEVNLTNNIETLLIVLGLEGKYVG